MLSYGREMKKKNKHIDWLPSGIFSSHYLLERLPQAGTKIWHPDEEVFSFSLKKYKNPDTLLHGWKN